MGLFDIAENMFNMVKPFASEILPQVPLVGEMISAGQAGYEMGAAAYDGLTGDRDGAVYHGAKGATQLIGCIPGAKPVMSTVNRGLAIDGNYMKTMGKATGNKDVETGTPTSMADLAGKNAVFAVNAMFGKDDTNWIAPGDKPTGTRAGEVAAGIMGIASPFLYMGDDIMGGAVHSLVEKHVTPLLGVDPTAKTSGTQYNAPAAAGQWVHNLNSNLAPDEDPRIDRRFTAPRMDHVEAPAVPMFRFEDLPKAQEPQSDVPTVRFEDLPKVQSAPFDGMYSP